MAGLGPDNIRLEGPEPEPLPEPIDVVLEPDAPAIMEVDPVTGAMTTLNADGSAVVDLDGPPPEGADAAGFDANLAELIDPGELARIADDLLTGIEADNQSRAEWLETRAQGIGLLGLQLKTANTADSAPLEGMSTVDHPLLLEATLRFQANARGELLPANGPVKVRDDSISVDLPPPAPPPEQMPPPGGQMPMMPPMEGMGAPPPMPDNVVPIDPSMGMPPMPMEQPPPGIGHNGGPAFDRDGMAEALEADLNHYLTTTAKEYYPDTDRMLLYVGFGGCGFKKVYRCPIRRRPVSESVDAKDLIVSNAATDLTNSGRVTHQIMMRPSMLTRMQLVGAYRKIASVAESQPTPTPNAVEEKVAEVQGVKATPAQPQDGEHTIYECYCELDIKGFEHKAPDEDTGENVETGLEVPYIVVIDKDTREVLAVRRNWEEGDELCNVKLPFVKYPFVPGLGFYDIGLIHILGNTTKAVTAAWRLMLDAGMFANFPGFLFLRTALRGNTNTTFRVGPGQGVAIDSSVTDIRQAIMALPYKEAGAGLMQLVDNVAETGSRVGGTAEIAVGEGRQDAPVGTTIALMEQATKIVDAVHKRLHAAQSEEFQLLKAEFRKDPEPLWRGYKKSKIGQRMAMAQDGPEKEAAKQLLLAALDDADIVPAADPNTPSHMHRIMKAVAIMQLMAANPDLYDPKEVHLRVLHMLNIEDAEQLFIPPQPPPEPQPSPDMQLGVQGELQKTAMNIASKEKIAAMQLAMKEKEILAKDQQAIVALAAEIVAQMHKKQADDSKAETDKAKANKRTI